MLGNRLIRSALLLLGTFLLSMQSQAANDLFKARYETHKAMTIERTFTNSESISLDNLGTIYALSIDATITQPRESSFARVVLEDKDGHQYLVAECDRFRYDEDVVNLQQFCQETAALKGIKPLSLKCYVAGDATLQISEIHTTSTPPTRGIVTKEETNQMRKEQAQDVVDRINAYNRIHGKLWVAGLTSRSQLSYNEEAVEVCTDPYVSNIKYYKDGIYEMGERLTFSEQRKQNFRSPNVVTLPTAFDWTNYQGINWMTPVKDQENSKYCVSFASIAVTEALANIYYNRKMDLDLSEYEAAWCGGIPFGWGVNSNLPISVTLERIRDIGAVYEDVFPFVNTPYPPTLMPANPERITISDISYIGASADSINKIKEGIITKGPAISGYQTSNIDHVMCLVGYGRVTPGSYYLIDNSTTVPSNIPIAGQTYWVFKDSYGIDSTRTDRYNGYKFVVFNDYSYMHDVYFAEGPVIRSEHPDTIVVTDNDGDGYFYWGITNELPIEYQEEYYYMPWDKDFDDSNPARGRALDYVLYDSLYVDRNNVWTISNNVQLNYGRYNKQHINIVSGGTLNINTTLYNHRDVCIWIEADGKLVVNGGTIQNGIVAPESGSSTTIKNGGVIVHSLEDYFEVPLGATFNFQQGKLNYRNN